MSITCAGGKAASSKPLHVSAELPLHPGATCIRFLQDKDGGGSPRSPKGGLHMLLACADGSVVLHRAPGGEVVVRYRAHVGPVV